MSCITRFAPSPTGLLHIGNARTALISYLFAKKNHGQFMLRLDDTDIDRSREDFAKAIENDLKWLGMDWDIFSKQSERSARYEEIKQKLIADGRLYPCYETAEEIEIKRKMLLSRGRPPIYDRQALTLTTEQKDQYEREGRKKHWRFKLDEKAIIKWNDLIKGETIFKAENLSDPVLIRTNGYPTYMLPSVIDDIDFKITHIIRGEDHVSNTAIQIQIFEALGAKLPDFAHNSLMKSKDSKISKREGGFDIGALRDNEHIEPMAINSILAKLGSSDPIEPCTNLPSLIEKFNLSSFGKAAAIYDSTELAKMNNKILHLFNYAEVKNRPELKDIDEEFWNLVKNNITRLPEIKIWHDICKKPLSPIIEDLEFTKLSSTLLPEDKIDESTWDKWMAVIKTSTPRKGKELFMPIRKALTALEHGPELRQLLPLIGREKVIARLNGQTA